MHASTLLHGRLFPGRPAVTYVSQREQAYKLVHVHVVTVPGMHRPALALSCWMMVIVCCSCARV